MKTTSKSLTRNPCLVDWRRQLGPVSCSMRNDLEQFCFAFRQHHQQGVQRTPHPPAASDPFMQQHSELPHHRSNYCARPRPPEADPKCNQHLLLPIRLHLVHQLPSPSPVPRPLTLRTRRPALVFTRPCPPSLTY